MFSALLFAFAGLAGVLAGPSPLAARQDTSAQRAPGPLEIFQTREDLLFRVGYRLAVANAPYCDASVRATGLLIHDAYSYGNPALVRKILGLTGDIGVQSVAPGSPAALAGLTQNDTILAIGDMPVTQGWQMTERRWERIAEIRDAIDDAASSGPVRLSWSRTDGSTHSAEIASVPACPTRFELRDSKSNAAADGERVLVGENFPGFDYDEASFAAAIAHEMAHNILRHPQFFGETGWKRNRVRLSERDADRLMPWLLHNAGYDSSAAIRFMETWGPKYGGGILRKRTHDGWDERVEFITAELVTIRSVTAPDGAADWKTYFRQLLQTP